MRPTLSPDTAPPHSSQPLLAPAPQDARLAGFHGARFWFLAGSLFGGALLAAVLMAIIPLPGRAAISSSGVVLSLLFAATCSFWISQRATPGRAQWGWRFIALAEVGYVLAELLVLDLSAPRPSPPNLGLAVVLFLPCYGLGSIAVILLPVAQTSGIRLVRVVLDVCIVVGALLGLALVAVFASRLAGGTSANAVFVVIPVADVIALLALVVVLVRGVQVAYRPTFCWLIGGVGCFAYADAALNYLTLPKLQAYAPGSPLVDSFWIAGACALSLAPLSLLRQGSGSDPTWAWLEQLTRRLSRPRRAGLVGQVLMLTTPVLVLFGLLALSTLKPQPDTTLPLELLTLAVVVLILIRQVLTMRDLVEARVATAHAEHLDALKDQFITSVNHELRTPVMTVHSNLALLRALYERQDVDPVRRSRMLERAERATEALVQLIETILDVRRIDQDASLAVPEVVNIHAAALAALTLIDLRQGNAPERVVEMRVPEALTIWGEPVRLQQILTNLLSNAIKYSPPGTTVTVAAQAREELAGRHWRLGTTSDHGQPWVEMTVHDEGLGIPPEQMPFLFRRFVRLERDIASPVRGTGLGLYLCRVFAEAMGGTIWGESTGVPGEGTTFYLRLPTPPADRSATLVHQTAREGCPEVPQREV